MPPLRKKLLKDTTSRQETSLRIFAVRECRIWNVARWYRRRRYRRRRKELAIQTIPNSERSSCSGKCIWRNMRCTKWNRAIAGKIVEGNTGWLVQKYSSYVTRVESNKWISKAIYALSAKLLKNCLCNTSTTPKQFFIHISHIDLYNTITYSAISFIHFHSYRRELFFLYKRKPFARS